MGRQFSVFLDFSRFLAALVVFFHHLSGFSGGIFWQLGLLAHESVVFFFVLSGYVIAYAASRPGKGLQEYCWDRATRIYSVALPALAITLLCDALGNRFGAGFHTGVPGRDGTGMGWTLLSALLFLNQSWREITVFSNQPYWSLGYEVWYYVLYGCILYSKGIWRILLLPAVLVAMGPSVLLYLPVWLFGVGAYFLARRLPPRPMASMIGAALFGAGAAVLCQAQLQEILDKGFMSAGAPLTGLLNETAHRFGSDLPLAASFACCLYFLPPCLELGAPFPEWAAGAIRLAASYTFSIYLFHMPLLALISKAMPYEQVRATNLAASLVVVPAAIVALGWMTEKKRQWLRDWLHIHVRSAWGPAQEIR